MTLFAIADMGGEHLLRRNGSWMQLPVASADLVDLVVFQDAPSAKEYARQQHRIGVCCCVCELECDDGDR